MVLLAAAILGGTAATYLLDDDAMLPARLCMGVPLGIVGFGLVGYVLGWLFGLSAGTVIASAAIVLAGPLVILGKKGRRAPQEDVARTRAEATRALRSPTRATVATVLLYAFMLFLMTRLLDRAFFEAPEGGGEENETHGLGDGEACGSGSVARSSAARCSCQIAGQECVPCPRVSIEMGESASSGWPATSIPPWTASSACSAGRLTTTRSCPPGPCAGGTS